MSFEIIDNEEVIHSSSDREDKFYWTFKDNDGKWWENAGKLTEAEAEDKFGHFGYEFKKHWSNQLNTNNR